MARRRKGNKVDGWLVIDKPLEITSAKVVGAVKFHTKAQKVGHGGTLDPLASGILPIGLGEATKTMPFIVDSSKEYEFAVSWGAETDSDDREGEITVSGGHIPTAQEVQNILPQFIGTIQQAPPAYSAIKVGGKRAYDLARSGAEVELAKRPVEIQSLTLLSHDEVKGQTCFHVTCGKGTYVRSLGRDIARALGSYAHISALRRTRVGPFHLEHAISLEKLEELGHSARAVEALLPISTALDDIPALAISEKDADAIKHGMSIKGAAAKQGTVFVTCGNTPVAIAEATDGVVRPLRVFNI